TPVEAAGEAGGQSTAPTRTSDPRGSLTTLERKSSWLPRRRSSRCANDPPPRSGAPETMTLVGSPPVCESMKPMRFTSSAHKEPISQFVVDGYHPLVEARDAGAASDFGDHRGDAAPVRAHHRGLSGGSTGEQSADDA